MNIWNGKCCSHAQFVVNWFHSNLQAHTHTRCVLSVRCTRARLKVSKRLILIKCWNVTTPTKKNNALPSQTREKNKRFVLKQQQPKKETAKYSFLWFYLWAIFVSIVCVSECDAVMYCSAGLWSLTFRFVFWRFKCLWSPKYTYIYVRAVYVRM